MWKHRRELREHLCDPSYWLGSDAPERIEAGETGAVLQQLLKWQKVLGMPDTPLPQFLAPVEHAAPSASPQDIATLRKRVVDTITVVSRIHGVNAKLTISRHWGGLNSAAMQRALDFCSFADRSGKDAGCSVVYTGEHPTRLLGPYGISGFLKIRITGNQFALETLMKSVRTVYPSIASDLEQHCSAWRKRTPLPGYRSALAALPGSLIPVDGRLLRKDLITLTEQLQELEETVSSLRNVRKRARKEELQNPSHSRNGGAPPLGV